MSTPSIHEAMNELEALADDIRVRIHLAGMDANDFWNKQLEPRLFAARQHAHDAKDASKQAVESTLEAFRDFQKKL